MQHQQTMNHLKSMKLGGMFDAFQQQLEQPNTYDSLSFLERFGLIVDQESNYRENKKYSRLVKNAKLKIQATIANIDYGHNRNLSKDVIANLLTFTWVINKQNILLTGSTGCGKTYLACAMGNEACLKGYSVKYYRANRLFKALTVASGDGSYYKLISQLAKTDVLIIDDWGLEQLTIKNKNNFLEIMEDRHNTTSTIMTSQLPTEKWHESINEPTLADAILDRLLHNAHKIELKGESMRKIKGKLTE